MKLLVCFLLFYTPISFATSLPIIADFFNPPKVKNVLINPSGDEIIMKIKHKNNYLLMLYQLKTRQQNVLFYEPKLINNDKENFDNIINVKWLSDNEILILLLLDDGSYNDYLITLSRNDDGVISTEFKHLSFYGHLVRPSRTYKRKLIVTERNRHSGKDIYYVDIDSEDKSDRLNDDLRQATHWLMGANDEIKVAWGIVEGEHVVWHRETSNENWVIVRKSKDQQESFWPVLITDESQTVLVLHNHNRNEIALQEFDLINKKGYVPAKCCCALNRLFLLGFSFVSKNRNQPK
jgi:hypothetical protein